jgi:hypothetical protein
MNPGDLELFTSQELIDELMRRATFQGVIIHARDGVKSPSWSGERVFRVRYNANLGSARATRLLEVVSRYMADADA